MSRGHGPARPPDARPAAGRTLPSPGPFALLGLPAGPQVSDDDVRAAWRRLAAATHPDRDDGGDPELFARAAAAYTALRTVSGRGEALADLAGLGAPDAASPAARTRQPAGTRRRAGPRMAAAWQAAAGQAGRVAAGRPARLALRLLAAVAVSAGAVAASGFSAAAMGLTTGALTWLILTARRDLGPPGRR
jgi:curved DNA-binding protein CbpA